MKNLLADLHIHTALSPCAEDDMTPPAIVDAAVKAGMNMIGICDHNSARNVASVQACAGKKLAVIPGIEITTSEEVHILGYFRTALSAEAVGDAVRQTLAEIDQFPCRSGNQLLIDEKGTIVGSEDRALFASSSLSLSAAVALIQQHGGLAAASHADRPSFSVISQLGFFPAEPRFDAVEISAAGVKAGKQSNFGSLGVALFTSSDSHFLSEIGSSTTIFRLNSPSLQELHLAFKGLDGRSCVIPEIDSRKENGYVK